MGTQANSGIARRRATFRRVTIAALVLVCLALFTGYFRETDGGPLHGAQSTAAGVVAPVQEVATRAVQPFRDAWGWATSLKDARDRAAVPPDGARRAARDRTTTTWCATSASPSSRSSWAWRRRASPATRRSPPSSSRARFTLVPLGPREQGDRRRRER